jgi:translation initiation factor 1A
MKNKIGGSGAKKAKNLVVHTRELTFKEDSQDYGIVTNILGGGHFSVMCLGDNTTRIATVRGSMRKKVWIVKEDYILVSLRDFQDSHCDIILKYTPDEVRMLKSYEEIPSQITTAATEEQDAGDDIQFDFNVDDI